MYEIANVSGCELFWEDKKMEILFLQGSDIQNM